MCSVGIRNVPSLGSMPPLQPPFPPAYRAALVSPLVQLQKRYYRCVKKFATVLVTGGATDDRRDVCLGRFDDFQDCVTVSALLF